MFYVYILTNKINTVLYIGITNNLSRRLYEHQHDLIDGFTKKYHVHKLIYYEAFHDPSTAIAREKQLKGWRREKKNMLIAKMNPNWDDLSSKVH